MSAQSKREHWTTTVVRDVPYAISAGIELWRRLGFPARSALWIVVARVRLIAELAQEKGHG